MVSGTAKASCQNCCDWIFVRHSLLSLPLLRFSNWSHATLPIIIWALFVNLTSMACHMAFNTRGPRALWCLPVCLSVRLSVTSAVRTAGCTTAAVNFKNSNEDWSTVAQPCAICLPISNPAFNYHFQQLWIQNNLMWFTAFQVHTLQCLSDEYRENGMVIYVSRMMKADELLERGIEKLSRTHSKYYRKPLPSPWRV